MAFTVSSLGSTIQGDDIVQATDTWTNRNIPAGTQAVVIAITYREGAGSGTVSSVTAQDSGGANPESFVKIDDYRSAGGGFNASLWYLLSPTSGTRDFEIVWSENINDSYYAAAAIEAGLDTANPIDAFEQVDENDGVDIAVTTTTDNCAVFCVVGTNSDAGPFTPPAGWTELADLSGGTAQFGDMDTWFGWIEAGAAGSVDGEPATVGGQFAAVIASFNAGAGGTNATATPTGVSGTGSVGTVQVNLSPTVSVTGVSGTGAVGTVNVSTGVNDNAAPAGVSATASLGTVTVTATISATASPEGVGATGHVGSVTVGIGAAASPEGVSATGSVGSVTVSTTGDVAITVSGVSATGDVGTVTLAGIAKVASVSGVSAVGSVGTVTIRGWLNPPPASNNWSGEGVANDIWTVVPAASGDWS